MAKVLFIIMLISLGVLGGVFLISRGNSTNSPDFSTITPYPSQTQQTQQQNQQTQQATPQVTPIPTTSWVSASTAAITTAKGTIKIQLYPQDAPKTVTNFATLAKIGYYNNLTFHRVEPGFVVQGGDPNGNGTGGYSIYGPTFEDELNASTSSYQEGYKEGVVAMANRGPNTNGSQFFIMLADNNNLPKNYTIFGKVIEGMDVVKQIVVGDKMTSVTIQ
ncbi:MAG TPA: peptidylprolyl isomerase [Patescibacteria group bacterium]|nr:peptidylprolyl isomerase [Patescibacteria group bacterium]